MSRPTSSNTLTPTFLIKTGVVYRSARARRTDYLGVSSLSPVNRSRPFRQSARRVGRDDGAAAGDRVEQRAVCRRIGDVDTTWQYRDRGAAGVQGTVVRCGVASERCAADGCDAVRGEVFADEGGDVGGVGACVTGSDHRDRLLEQLRQGRTSSHPQRERLCEDRPRRVVRRPAQEQLRGPLIGLLGHDQPPAVSAEGWITEVRGAGLDALVVRNQLSGEGAGQLSGADLFGCGHRSHSLDELGHVRRERSADVGEIAPCCADLGKAGHEDLLLRRRQHPLWCCGPGCVSRRPARWRAARITAVRARQGTSGSPLRGAGHGAVRGPQEQRRGEPAMLGGRGLR